MSPTQHPTPPGANRKGIPTAKACSRGAGEERILEHNGRAEGRDAAWADMTTSRTSSAWAYVLAGLAARGLVCVSGVVGEAAHSMEDGDR